MLGIQPGQLAVLASLALLDLATLASHSRFHHLVPTTALVNRLGTIGAVHLLAALVISSRLRQAAARALAWCEGSTSAAEVRLGRTTGLAAGLFIIFHVLVFQRLVLAGGDASFGTDDLSAYYPSFLHPAVWRADVSAGTPSCADPQAFNWYPLAILLRHLPGGWAAFSVLPHVIASLGAFVLARCLTRGFAGPFAAGLVFGASGFLMGHHGHLSMVHAIAWVPWLLAALHALIEKGTPARAAAVAGTSALTLLGGHPQAALYGFWMAGVFGLSLLRTGDGGPARTAARVGVALAVGGGLAAIQLLPTLHLLPEFQRSGQATLEIFGYLSLPLDHLPMLILPLYRQSGGVSPWNYTELGGYVGVVSLVPLVAGLLAAGRDRRSRVWCVLAAVGLLAALGSSTPAVEFFYRLPLFNWFRCPGRHLAEVDLCAAMLVALGVEDLRRGSPRRALVVASAILGVAALSLLGSRFWVPEIVSPAVTLGSGLLLFAGGAALCKRWSLSADGHWPHLFLLLLALDMGTFAYRCLPFSPLDGGGRTCPPELLPVLESQRTRWGRFLSLRGALGTRAEGAPEATRLWGITALGGYGPLMPARLRQIVQMWGDGNCLPDVLKEDHRGLDVLGARLVGLPPPGAGGGPDGLVLDIPRGTTRLELLTRVISGDYTKPGEVGALILRRGGREVSRVRWRAGHETAFSEVPIADRLVALPTWDVTEFPSRWAASTVVVPPEAPDTVQLVSSLRAGTLEVALVDALDGGGRAQQLLPTGSRRQIWPGVDLAPARWRTVSTTPMVVLVENLRARPRAWLLARVVGGTNEQHAETIRTGVLPDGRPFDPAEVALVDSGVLPLLTALTGPPSDEVRVTRDAAGDLEVEVEADRSALLVVNEGYSRGWRCWIDGERRHAFPVDVGLIGLPLEAGPHRIVLDFSPWSLRVGGYVSAAAAAVCAAWLLLSLRARPRAESAAGLGAGSSV